MSTKRENVPDFVVTVREALKRLKKPKELGDKSPLAAPYFLGNKLKSTDTTLEAHGKVLAGLLREIIEEDIVDWPYQHILKRRYLDGVPANVVEPEVGVKRAQYNIYQSEATVAVGFHLVQKVRRSLYLENPPIPPPLFDRANALASILNQLNTSKDTAPKSVILTGSGGVGKTTLGGQIANIWQEENALLFWYTIRPGLTDQLSTLFFNLAYFLDQQGQSIPWLDLVSKEGVVEPEPMLGLMRAAIAKLTQKPLLCFDELDLLDSSHSEQSQVMEFINALRGTVSMLWVGQQVRLEADHIETLDGLSLAAIDEFSRASGIHLKPEQLTQLQIDTQGNPRLLNLFMALYETGEEIQTILDEVHKSPSIEYLLNRILIRLDETEQQVLMQLAVFRAPAPSYIWQQKAQTGIALRKMVDRRLIRTHQDGLISLLPAYRRTILNDLTNEQKRQLHRQAANVRSQFAQYTEAVYHLTEAQLPDTAIRLWHKYDQQEINRGQSGAALIILEHLKESDISNENLKKLHNSCAKLKHLHGNLDEALQDLQISLQATPVLEIEALEIEGQIENDRRNYLQAQSAFSKALTHVERFIENRLSFIHKGLGWSHIHEWDIKKARYEAELASYEAGNFRGYVQEEQNLYMEAEATYISALAIATQIKHTEGIAKTANNLARLHGLSGQFESAKQYHKRAAEAYQQAGKFTGITGCDINLSLICTLSGEYTQALEILENIEAQWHSIGFTIQPWQKSLIELMRADIYVCTEEWDAAQKSLDYVFEDENPTNMPDALRIRGELCLGQGNFEAAQISIQKSINFANEQEIPYLEAYAWRAMGKVHLAINNPEEAKSAFEQAIQLFNQLELPHEVAKTEIYDI